MILNAILSIVLIFGPPNLSSTSWQDADAGSLGISELIPVEGSQKAIRVDPPEPEPVGINDLPFAPEGLSNCEEMNFYRVQAGLPSRFNDYHSGPRSTWGIGWRESNCRNEESVHTSCCWGYWQMHQQHFRQGNIFDQRCDVQSKYDVDSDIPIDKQRQACAAKVLYEENGLSPWQ